MGDDCELKTELSDVLNRLSRENESDTPDFLLADYMLDSLRAYEHAVKARDKWFGFTAFQERDEQEITRLRDEVARLREENNALKAKRFVSGKQVLEHYRSEEE